MLARWIPLVVLAACGGVVPTASPTSPAGSTKPAIATPLRAKPSSPPLGADALKRARAEASAGIQDPKLQALVEEHWQWVLREQPLRATRLSVHAFDTQIPDYSPKAQQRGLEFRKALLAKLKALTFPASKGKTKDQVTSSLLQTQLRAQIASHECAFHLWTVSPRDNPLTEWNELHELHQVKTEADARNLLARYFAISKAVDQVTSNLRSGLSRKLVANAESVRRVITMVERQFAQPNEQWPLAAPLKKAYPKLTPSFVAGFKKDLASYLPTIRSALERYRDLLKKELLPQARDEETPV